MDPARQDQLKQFFKICYERLNEGEKVHGEKFETLDLFKEIEEELADVSNYAFLQYLKVLQLKAKVESVRQSSNPG